MQQPLRREFSAQPARQFIRQHGKAVIVGLFQVLMIQPQQFLVIEACRGLADVREIEPFDQLRA